MFLQKSGKVLADQSPNIQERHHHYCHADKTKWCLENKEENEGLMQGGDTRTDQITNHKLVPIRAC